MLGGLLGRGFAGKCKSLIKATKNRIDVIRRKRNATQKFLKKDIADLLSNGLDINAFGRVEGFLTELILSSCYDFIDKCCDIVLKYLSVMQKQRECPEDSREAVSCLMFAAARFSDLPELRDLRHLFHERYANSLELFVNRQFVENLASNPPTMERKVKLMQDIASEFSIKWDFRAFEQRMSEPAAVSQVQLKKYGSFHVNDDKCKSSNGKFADAHEGKIDVSFKGKLESGSEKYHLHDKEGNSTKTNVVILQPRENISLKTDKPHREENLLRKEPHDPWGKQESVSGKYEPLNEEEDAAATRSSRFHGIRERTDGRTHLNGSSEYSPHIEDNWEMNSQQKQDLSPGCAGVQSKDRDKKPFVGDNLGDKYGTGNSTRKIQEGNTPKLKPYKNAIPPPYVKPNGKQKDSRPSASFGLSHAGFDSNRISRDLSKHQRDYPVNTADRDTRGMGHPYFESRISAPNENDHVYEDSVVDNPVPKLRSSRRRHKSQHAYDDVSNFEERGAVRRKSRIRRRDDSRRGLQLLFDDERHQNDEEERMLDKLLMHYSKKPSSREQGKVRKKSRSHHVRNLSSSAGEFVQNEAGDSSDEVPEMNRSISLPCEQMATSEAPKVFARAASFEPDRSSGACHVHPKLPDYDDLAARFLAMKGR